MEGPFLFSPSPKHSRRFSTKEVAPQSQTGLTSSSWSLNHHFCSYDSGRFLSAGWSSFGSDIAEL